MATLGHSFAVPVREPDGQRRPPGAILGWIVLAGVGLLYLAMAIGFFATIWFKPGGPFSTALGVGGDPQLAIWFLRWQGFALAHGHNLLFTTYLDAPQGVNLMWNTTAPLLGVALAPLTLTLGGVFAYNVAETLGLASSAMAAFVMIRRYVRATDTIGTLATLVGGALYGFSPYMAAHALGHPPAVTLFAAPLMLLVFDDLFVRQGGRPVPAWRSACWRRCSCSSGKNCCWRRRWSGRWGSWCFSPSAPSLDRPSRSQPSFDSGGATPPGASRRRSSHSSCSLPRPHCRRWRRHSPPV